MSRSTRAVRPGSASTLASPQASPAARRPDRPIPPELDALCFAALAEAPAARPTARGLADQVQAYLDGDRDAELRRRLAAEQLALARAALAEGSATARATAIPRAGRALALDPGSAEAAALVTSLIVEPPRELPPELVVELEREEQRLTITRTRIGVYAYSSLFAFWLVIPFLGIKNWSWLIALFAVVGALALLSWRTVRTGRYNLAVGLVGNFVLAILWTRLAGIFLLTPVLLSAVLLALTTTTWLIRRPWFVLLWTVAAFGVPIALEALGVLATSWEVTRTAIISTSSIFRMEGGVAHGSLVLANVVFVTMVGLIGARIHSASKDAKRTLFIQNWHMNHLIPSHPRP